MVYNKCRYSERWWESQLLDLDDGGCAVLQAGRLKAPKEREGRGSSSRKQQQWDLARYTTDKKRFTYIDDGLGRDCDR